MRARWLGPAPALRWGDDGLTPLAISPRQRLDDVIRTRLRPAVRRHRLRAADALRPREDREIDTFVIYTDSETWAGTSTRCRRCASTASAPGIAARLIVVGMVSNGFTIADPDDAGMLDVVGFDTATPDVVSGFAAGRCDDKGRPNRAPLGR